MDILTLTEEILAGRRIRRGEENLLLSAPTTGLLEGANRLRAAFCGNRADLCSIINGRSGRCSEDCKFCAQSARHCTGISEYGFLSEAEILAECRHNEERGVTRFSIVTAGRTLSGADFEKALAVYRFLRENCGTALCGSHGLLTAEQFAKLKAAGVSRYHCNLETSRRYFPHICTTHTFDDKIACIKRAKAAGLEVCSGGIIGMGETMADRLDMALTLAELGVHSVPVNALIPIAGTPLESLERLTEEEILRTVAMFRYLLPEADIRLAAGRDLLTECGRQAFAGGANAAITGDMLTTSGNGILDDVTMLEEMGFAVERELSG